MSLKPCVEKRPVHEGFQVSYPGLGTSLLSRIGQVNSEQSPIKLSLSSGVEVVSTR